MIWEGKTQNGDDFYIRFRWGVLHLFVGEETLFREQISDSMAGIISLDEVKKKLSHYISIP